jgi:ribulose-5-phosphate 4-epimerase/fuculose-1-phosphate aldolase
MDEGYIKYDCNWILSDEITHQQIEEINTWRKIMKENGLIGMYENGIGFGNISIRINKNIFLISGSATGGIDQLDETHYALVTDYNISNNSLTCKGAVKASSESLTHAVVYECSPETQAIIHVHNNHLWKKYIDQVPTTKQNVAYGTPEMGREVARLFRETTVAEMRMIVMVGHEDGIIGFGKTLEEAGNVFLSRL